MIELGVMSRETSCAYMRIAKNWNHPEIVEAQKSGVVIDSIAKFLNILRAADPNPDGEDGEEIYPPRTERQMRNQFMRESFSHVRMSLNKEDQHKRFEKLCAEFFPFMQEFAKYPASCRVFLNTPKKFLRVLNRAIAESVQEARKSQTDEYFQDEKSSGDRWRPKGIKPRRSA